MTIASFEARFIGVGVELLGTFRSDLEIERVNVYRGQLEDLELLRSFESLDGAGFRFVDDDVEGGATYRYRIGVMDAEGEVSSPVRAVRVPIGNVVLRQNVPNPFNPSTAIRFSLPETRDVRLAVYDMHGRLVRTFVDEVRGHGPHEVLWFGDNDFGEPIRSGVYFYRLMAGPYTESRRMVLLK